MDNFLDRAKKQLMKSAFRHVGEEETEVRELLHNAAEYRKDLLHWLFQDYGKGTIDIRKQAGLEYVKNYPAEGWKILEALIRSDDPDNRDTANEILQVLEDPRSFEWIKLLLYDPYPYLQFDACDFLKDRYPDEVIRVLRNLLQHEYKHVQDAARKRLLGMGVNSDEI